MGRKIIDCIGQKFGFLTVVALAPERDVNGGAVWLTNCDNCGRKGKTITTSNLKKAKSCGCLKSRAGPLTQDRLRRLLDYNPTTGDFFWKVDKNQFAKADNRAGHIDNDLGYRIIAVDGESYTAHRLAWFYVHGSWPKKLDHKDRDGLNNRIANLREATQGQNATNSKLRRDNSSGFKGVTRNKRGWGAQVHQDGKRIWLGTFPTPEEAHMAYCKKGQELYGEFFCDGSA